MAPRKWPEAQSAQVTRPFKTAMGDCGSSRWKGGECIGRRERKTHATRRSPKHSCAVSLGWSVMRGVPCGWPVEAMDFFTAVVASKKGTCPSDPGTGAVACGRGRCPTGALRRQQRAGLFFGGRQCFAWCFESGTCLVQVWGFEPVWGFKPAGAFLVKAMALASRRGA